MKVTKKSTGRNPAGEQRDKLRGSQKSPGKRPMPAWSRADGTGDRADRANLACVGDRIKTAW